jgi:peptide/nickel transport system substrate-binding protein
MRKWLMSLLIAASVITNIGFAEAHLIGSGVMTKTVENYEVRFLSLPFNPVPGQPANLGFSILDEQGQNVFNISAKVAVEKDGETIYATQNKHYEISDIFMDYVFPEEGNYLAIIEAEIPDDSKSIRADFSVDVREWQGPQDGGGGCVIATAAFGSELTPQVQFLRKFRDEKIMPSFAGSSFMQVFNSWYYSFSPAVAEYERQQPWLQNIVKAFIYPLIGILHVSEIGYSLIQGELGAIFGGLIASSLIGMVYLSPMSLIVKRAKTRKFIWKPMVLVTALALAGLIGSVMSGNVSATMISSSIFVLSMLSVSAIAFGSLVVRLF